MKPFPKFVKARHHLHHFAYFNHQVVPTESLLGRWSRFCLKQCLSASEAVTTLAPFDAKAWVLRQEVGIPSLVRDRAMANWANGQRRVAEVLGLSSVDLACSTGGILGCSSLCARSFVPQLRWCPACFAKGFHSVVFQHRAMATCPFHGDALVDACPRCGHEHRPTYCSVARQPFGCPGCQEIWLPPGRRPGLPMDAPVIGPMLEDRARELGITDRPQRTFVARSTCETPSRMTRSACRTSARCLVWPLGISWHWPKFQTSTALLNDWEVETRLGIRGADQVAAVRDCLSWLEHACGLPDESRAIRRPRSMAPSINSPISVAAVALHLTMVKYTKQRLKEDSPIPTVASIERVYDDVVWTGYQASSAVIESPTGNALIARAEILTYFSLALLNATRLACVGPHGWGVNADQRNVSATNWVVEPGSGGHLLHFRPRASTQSVKRLLHRYRNHKVKAWPDHDPIGSVRHWFSGEALHSTPKLRTVGTPAGTLAEVAG